MRITSPKNIPFSSQESSKLSIHSLSQKNGQIIDHKKQVIKSYHNSNHNSRMQCNEEYALNINQSAMNEQISNRTPRSNSKYGITMSRDKTIRIQNIYEPQHFGQGLRNSENSSAKSITAKSISQSNKNTKSVSRMTRATSPTTTHYTEQKSIKSIPSASMKLINNTNNREAETNYFDFKQLNQQIRNVNTSGKSITANKQEIHSFKLLPQEEQYYADGNEYQLMRDEYNISLGKINLGIKNQPPLSQTQQSECQPPHKIHQMRGKKPSRVNDSIVESEYNLRVHHLVKQETIVTKTAHQSSLSREKQVMRFPHGMGVNSKLNWQDVIKK